MYKKFCKEKGIVIITVLVMGAVLLILGIAIAYITQLGFFSISAEARYQTAEKRANYGLMKAIDYMLNSDIICSNLNSQSYGSGIEVRSSFANSSLGGSCFIWSKGSFRNAKVVKTTVINISPPLYGPVIIKNLAYFNLKGSSAIVSCVENCITPALIIGNEYEDGLPDYDPYEVCPNNPKGLVALAEPVSKENVLFDAYEIAFNEDEVSNRTSLLNNIQNLFGVTLDNGTPTGIKGENIWTAPPDISINNCNATNGNIIKCTINTINATATIEFTYNNGNFTYNNGTSYDGLDLGNATLNIDNFSGSAKIYAKTIYFNKNDSKLSNAILVGNTINITSNNVSITNAKLFAQNYNITGNGLELEGGIIYGGGSGIANFNLNSDLNLGSSDNPVLIILDNVDVSIEGKGNVDVYGLIFTTEADNEFVISGNGNFELHGVLVSNSQATTIDLSGNFEIIFDPKVITTLSHLYSFVSPPECGTLNVNPSLTFTEMRVY